MPKKINKKKNNVKNDLMKNINPNFLNCENRYLINTFGTTISYLIDFFIMFITISYLKDLRSNINCNKLNSKILNFYYDYYTFVFFLPIIMSILFPFLIYNLYFNFKATIVFTMIICLICFIINVYFIKLLYDLGKEDECKDIDPNYRQFLFYLNLFGLIISIANIFIRIIQN